MMTSDIPHMTEEQYRIATKVIQKLNDKECPENLKDGRVHELYFYAHGEGRIDYHYCKTCGKTYEIKRAA